jgi:hypothetical protein
MSDNKLTQLELIDKIITWYPELKKEKKNIIDKLNGKVEQHCEDELVVEKMEYDGKILYRNKSGAILDKNLVLVGTYKLSGGIYSYNLFDELKNDSLHVNFDSANTS